MIESCNNVSGDWATWPDMIGVRYINIICINIISFLFLEDDKAVRIFFLIRRVYSASSLQIGERRDKILSIPTNRNRSTS